MRAQCETILLFGAIQKECIFSLIQPNFNLYLTHDVSIPFPTDGSFIQLFVNDMSRDAQPEYPWLQLDANVLNYNSNALPTDKPRYLQLDTSCRVLSFTNLAIDKMRVVLNGGGLGCFMSLWNPNVTSEDLKKCIISRK